ncbi:MAG: iron-sulfur cluster assembly protein [Actinobacteria bacterium]|nr:iron-sulfur cluster assembly protein [Actinomycetota bacterium]MCL6104856.1 iron-sulfur cluster assembly protein [Actinomycetota bacterium]
MQDYNYQNSDADSQNGSNDQDYNEIAVNALYNVVDPELNIDIINLGLVYKLIASATNVYLEMTLTTPGCPVSESLPQEAKWALSQVFPPQCRIEVQVVWDPPWSPERMSEKAAQMLGWHGR